MITPIFSSFVVEDQLPVDHDIITQWIQQHKHHDKIELTLQESDLQEYFNTISDLFNRVHNQIGLSSHYYQEIKESWVNTNSAPRFNVAHNHPTSTFVSVYYPYVIDPSPLEFINPNLAAQYVLQSELNYSVVDDYNQFTSQRWRIIPRTGSVVVFPSWLQHYALPNEKDQRFSIATNSIIKHH